MTKREIDRRMAKLNRRTEELVTALYRHKSEMEIFIIDLQIGKFEAEVRGSKKRVKDGISTTSALVDSTPLAELEATR